MTLVYIEVILMIVLAIATIPCLYFGLVLHQKKYAHHVAIGQPTKSQQRLLEHPYIYVLCALLWLIFVSWLVAYQMEGSTQQFFFGVFISLLSMVLGQVIGGLLIFLYSIKNPGKISGQTVFEGKKFRALHLQPTFMACLVLLISLAIIHPTPFILGSLVAAMGMSLTLFMKMFIEG